MGRAVEFGVAVVAKRDESRLLLPKPWDSKEVEGTSSGDFRIEDGVA